MLHVTSSKITKAKQIIKHTNVRATQWGAVGERERGERQKEGGREIEKGEGRESKRQERE